MRRSLHIIAVGAALAVAIGAVSMAAAAGRSSQTAAQKIVRPQFTPAPPKPTLDLTAILDDAGLKRLAQLASDPAICREALKAVGVSYVDLPATHEPDTSCGFEDALQVQAGFSDYSIPLEVTCPLAVRLYAWEFDVVAPAAEKHFGVKLAGIEASGSYSCRRRAGDGKLSQHAFARAADISGFRLADGRVIAVEGNYWISGPEREFLREAHAGACRIFDVTLGPAYNAAHADHFHVDAGGERACR